MPASTVGRLLGEKVTARKVTSELAARTLTCSYVPDEQDRDAPFLEVRSTPDPIPLDAMVGLYLGVDRLQHHPVEIDGADDAEVILQPDDDLVTVFAKQGFVTHTVILGVDDLGRGEHGRRQAGAPGGVGEPLADRADSRRSAFQRDSAYSSATSERTVMPPPVPSR